MHLVAVLLVSFISFAAHAAPPNTPWPSQCPAGVSPQSVGCEPQAAAPSATDLIPVWQVDESPRQRAMQVQQIAGRTLAPDTAAVKALSYADVTYVIRAAFSSTAPAPPQLYKLASAACVLNSGNGDDGYEIKLTAGGCATAQFGTEADVRQWGCINDGVSDQNGEYVSGTDNTACWIAADRAFAVMTSKPALVLDGPNVSVLSASTASSAGCFLYVAEVKGRGNAQMILGTVNRQGSSANMCFGGTGPFEVSGIYFIQPMWDLTTLAAPLAQNMLRIQTYGAVETATSASNIYIHENRFFGGQNQININRTNRVRVINNVGTNPYLQCGTVTQGSDTNVAVTDDMFVEGNICYVPGRYGYVIPGNNSQSQATAASRVGVVRNNTVIGGGWFANKPCYDMTASASDGIVFTGNVGFDCMIGGMESKHTGQPIDAGPSIPIWFKSTTIQMTFYTHYNSGFGCGIFYNIGGALAAVTREPNERAQTKADCYVSYTPAPVWTSGFSYLVGQSVQGGVGAATTGVYMAVRAGIADGAQPSGSAATTQCGSASCSSTTGGLVWIYRQDMPATVAVSGASVLAGQSGTGYSLGTIATVNGGTCTAQPQVKVSELVPGGSGVTRVEVYFEGTCTVLPDGTSTTAGSGSGLQLTLYSTPVPDAIYCGETQAVTDVDFHCTAHMTSHGVRMRGVGSTDQTVRRLKLRVDGVVHHSCVSDTISGGFGVQNGKNVGLRLEGECTSLGQSTAGAMNIGNPLAIQAWTAWNGSTNCNSKRETGSDPNTFGCYYVNSLVTNDTGKTYIVAACANTSPCHVATSGGPTGTGLAITDGDATWNYYGTVTQATLDYNDCEIGGTWIVQGPLYGIRTRGSTVNCLLKSNTRIEAGDGALRFEGPGTFTIESGARLAVTGATPGKTPLSATGASAAVTVQIKGKIDVSTTAAVGGATFPCWSVASSAAITLSGGCIRGSSTGAPTSTAGAIGDLFLEDVPAAAGAVEWWATTASTTSATWKGLLLGP